MIFRKYVQSQSREQIIDISLLIAEAVQEAEVQEGLCCIFIPHTTCAVTINENADPDVKRDILFYLKKLVPPAREFQHAEGNSDAHIKTLLTGNSTTLILEKSKPLHGTWQGIYFCEYDGPRRREIVVKIIEG